MRIALMTNNYKPFIGGVPISIERLAKGLEALGHEVTVFAPTYAEQQAESDCFRYSSFSQKFIGGIVLPNPFDMRIEKEFKKNNYDIIHVHHPVLIGRTAVYLSHKYNIPLTYTYHTRYEQYLSYVKGIRTLEKGASRNNGVISRLQKSVLSCIQDKLTPAYLGTFFKQCDHIFAPTEGMRRYLVNSGIIDEEHVDVLPTGIEENSFKQLPGSEQKIRQSCNAENMPLFISVSRMSHEKNIDFLLLSIAEFKVRYAAPFRVLMIGDGPNRADYEKRCTELNISNEVKFIGKVANKDIAPYYAAADAFVFASKTETQGIVILEAFAGGTPVIAVRASGVCDLVVNDENGFMCTEEIGALAGRMYCFATDRGIRERLTRGAIETSKKYSEDEVAKSAARIYNKVIAEYNERTVDKKGKLRYLASAK